MELKNTKLILGLGDFGVKYEALKEFKFIKGVMTLLSFVSVDSFVFKEQKVEALENFPIYNKIMFINYKIMSYFHF